MGLLDCLLLYLLFYKRFKTFVFLSQYAKLSSDFSPVFSSASDWNFLKGMLNLHTHEKKV